MRAEVAVADDEQLGGAFAVRLVQLAANFIQPQNRSVGEGLSPDTPVHVQFIVSFAVGFDLRNTPAETHPESPLKRS